MTTEKGKRVVFREIYGEPRFFAEFTFFSTSPGRRGFREDRFKSLFAK